MKLKQFLIDHRENLQLLYGIFLIVLIPLLIAYNTIFILNTYNQRVDDILNRETMIIGRSIYAALQEDLGDRAALQTKIDRLAERNTDFQNLKVLVPKTKTQADGKESDGFEIVASSDAAETGKFLTFYFYQNTWDQPDNDGLSTNSRLLMATDEDSDLALDAGNTGRFLIYAMPMRDASGEKQAILSMQLSSEVVNDLTETSRNKSLSLLFVTVIITIFFLSVTVRLWDYVVLYRKIKEVDQMKDEFISIASHELRTPLTSIKGYTSLIQEGTFGKIEDPKMQQSLERIMSSTKRLGDLVEDLLDVSRLEQGRLACDQQALSVEPIIDEIVSQLSVTAQEKQLALSYEYEKSAQPLPLVSADPDRLRQVLVNLIGNAIKYTEAGSVVVTQEIKENKLRIKVTDTGLGISPEAQKSLFQKFYRVKTDKTETIQGTGLGLWITKQIVELMGGRIYLESIEGRGTQVIVVLNLAGADKK